MPIYTTSDGTAAIVVVGALRIVAMATATRTAAAITRTVANLKLVDCIFDKLLVVCGMLCPIIGPGRHADERGA